jgi:hypothetical protein
VTHASGVTATGGSPPFVENPLLPSVERSDVRLLNSKSSSTSKDREALSSST